MKAIVGGAIGVAALGGALLLANTRSTSNAVQASSPAQTVASTAAAQPGPTYVDCGEGRMALIQPVAPGQTYSQVVCAPAPATMAAPAWAQTANYLVPPGAYQVPQGQAEPQVVYRNRVVYRDRPVSRSTASRARTYRAAQTVPYRSESRVRNWKTSALIIGGSAAGGAGVGAILGGKSGAKKGAIVGGIGGLVYDIATREKKG